MIGGKKVLALIPARAGSKGLPDKNIRPLMGKPLLAWPIEAALASRAVDRVILSTDSEDYARIGAPMGPRRRFCGPPIWPATPRRPSGSSYMRWIPWRQRARSMTTSCCWNRPLP